MTALKSGREVFLNRFYEFWSDFGRILVRFRPIWVKCLINFTTLFDEHAIFFECNLDMLSYSNSTLISATEGRSIDREVLIRCIDRLIVLRVWYQVRTSGDRLGTEVLNFRRFLLSVFRPFGNPQTAQNGAKN